MSLTLAYLVFAHTTYILYFANVNVAFIFLISRLPADSFPDSVLV